MSFFDGFELVLSYLDDTEEGDLIHTDDDEKADEDGFSIIAMWNWERKNYFIKE
ncbi:replication domain protein [Limosilactobacillus reuteri]|uniref:replication domain protein n=1 Tax=Limosilactobacillus reuteri TaxID=1598 RepID=UPI000A9034F6|nr:replication domain protein [Limosilactobacillus reuteri]